MQKEKKQYEWTVTEGVNNNKSWKRYRKVERSRQR